ncbi:Guanine nucleotide exchange factor lte1 [Podila epigama]|nr:Guanine nucleotide exchange factor lte1 [Podila epigama]
MQIMLALQSTPVSRLYRTWALVRDQEKAIFADLVEFTSPFHNWRHLRETMKNIADDWGGAGGSGDTGAGESTTGSPSAMSPTAPATPDKQSGMGVSFFSMRSSKAAAASKGQAALLVAGHRKMASSPILSSKSKDKEKEKNATKTVVQQGGCIPFLGLYLSDLVFNTEVPSYVERPYGSTMSTGEHSLNGGLLINIHKHRTTATIVKRILTFRTIATRYPFQEEPEVQVLLAGIKGLDQTEMLRLSHQLEERATDSVHL